MRSARPRSGKRTPPPALTRRQRRVRRAIVIAAWTAVAAMALILILPRLRTTTPPELRGTWVTSAPGYLDRTITFEANRVILGTGNGTMDPSRIVRVYRKWDPLQHATLYEIRYREDGAILRLTLHLHEYGIRSVLRIRNQSGVDWVRS